MRLAALIIIGCVLFSSCKKKKVEYTINGTVTDNSLNQAQSGATVSLYTFAPGSSSGELFQTITTSSDGKYSFILPRENYQKIEIRYTKNNYFSDVQSINFDNITNSHENTFNISAYAYSWVRLHFVSDGTKDLKYIKQIGKSNCSECCDELEHYIYGATDESVYCINNGNSEYKIYYNVLNSTTQGPVSVTTVPFDTTELIVTY